MKFLQLSLAAHKLEVRPAAMRHVTDRPGPPPNPAPRRTSRQFALPPRLPRANLRRVHTPPAAIRFRVTPATKYYLLVCHTCTRYTRDNGVPIRLFRQFRLDLQTCFDVLAVRSEVQTQGYGNLAPALWQFHTITCLAVYM